MVSSRRGFLYCYCAAAVQCHILNTSLCKLKNILAVYNLYIRCLPLAILYQAGKNAANEVKVCGAAAELANTCNPR